MMGPFEFECRPYKFTNKISDCEFEPIPFISALTKVCQWIISYDVVVEKCRRLGKLYTEFVSVKSNKLFILSFIFLSRAYIMSFFIYLFIFFCLEVKLVIL